MTIIDLRTMRESSPPPFSVVCLGNFDGIHVGHEALVSATKEKAAELASQFPGVASGACFFKKAPTDFFPTSKVPHLMTFKQKLSHFFKLGLDYAFVTDFEEIRNESPEAFVQKTLRSEINCIFAVCGFNFHYGKGAAGNAASLSLSMNGCTTTVAPVCIDEMPVSSSSIRAAISAGDMLLVSRLLGRPYCIEAEVLHGKALGRTLGIPTINQLFPEELAIPKHGIYITKTHVDGKQYPSVTNVGIRPSLNDGTHINCETHILDFDQDIYGKHVKVDFLTLLRDEIHFADLDALRKQIHRDIQATKAYYKEA